MTLRAVKAVPSAKNLTWACDTVRTLSKSDYIALIAKSVAVRVGYIDLITPAELADMTSVP